MIGALLLRRSDDEADRRGDRRQRIARLAAARPRGPAAAEVRSARMLGQRRCGRRRCGRRSSPSSRRCGGCRWRRQARPATAAWCCRTRSRSSRSPRVREPHVRADRSPPRARRERGLSAVAQVAEAREGATKPRSTPTHLARGAQQILQAGRAWRASGSRVSSRNRSASVPATSPVTNMIAARHRRRASASSSR